MYVEVDLNKGDRWNGQQTPTLLKHTYYIFKIIRLYLVEGGFSLTLSFDLHAQKENRRRFKLA